MDLIVAEKYTLEEMPSAALDKYSVPNVHHLTKSGVSGDGCLKKGSINEIVHLLYGERRVIIGEVDLEEDLDVVALPVLEEFARISPRALKKRIY